MAIGNKQIGWSQEENLLWEISRQLDNMISVVCTGYCPTTTTTTTLSYYTWLLYISSDSVEICNTTAPTTTYYTAESSLGIGVAFYNDPELTLPVSFVKPPPFVGLGGLGSTIWGVNAALGTIASNVGTC